MLIKYAELLIVQSVMSRFPLSGTESSISIYLTADYETLWNNNKHIGEICAKGSSALKY